MNNQLFNNPNPIHNPDETTQPTHLGGEADITRPTPVYDPYGRTQVTSQPYTPHSLTRPVPINQVPNYQPTAWDKPKRRGSSCLKAGCLSFGILGILVLILGAVAVVLALVFSPGKTNILVLGIDRVEGGKGSVGRSDTMVLIQVDPLQPRVATLAIPRDLWVKISGVGENRINTAHFFAEANKAGSGPAAAMQTIQADFGVPVSLYVRIHLEGVPALIDALGGVTVTLTEPAAGYPVGQHHLDGTKALAFIRDRKTSDDFFRMEHGQIFIKAAAQQMLNPLTWWRIPLILAVLPQAVDTNISATQLPGLVLALLRVGPANIQSHTLNRDFVTPFTNSAGANVLLPRWDRITPFIKQIFGN